jgi:hypothetical protein
MKTHPFLLSAILITAMAGTCLSQVRVVTIGTVDKIDEKAKSISLIRATSATLEVPKESAGTSNGNTGRGTRGGKNGGSTDRPDTGTKNFPAPSGSPNKVPKNVGVTNYKIRILPTTVFKEGEKEIKFSDLKAGDMVEVTSPKPGSTLDAIELTLMPH